jgi:hypothetical protein
LLGIDLFTPEIFNNFSEVVGGQKYSAFFGDFALRISVLLFDYSLFYIEQTFP